MLQCIDTISIVEISSQFTYLVHHTMLIFSNNLKSDSVQRTISVKPIHITTYKNMTLMLKKDKLTALSVKDLIL